MIYLPTLLGLEYFKRSFMYRTEIYLRDDQKDILQDYSYYLTKAKKERVTISHLIREALDYWIRNSKPPQETKFKIPTEKNEPEENNKGE